MGPASKTPGSIVHPHVQVDAAVMFKPKAGHEEIEIKGKKYV